jgi:hypothetical protein
MNRSQGSQEGEHRMRYVKVSTWMILLGAMALGMAWNSSQVALRLAPAEAQTLLYTPPIDISFPKGRKGGGHRGSLLVLAPDHPGQTVQGAPTLYWYTAQAIQAPASAILTIQDMAGGPVSDIALQLPIQTGIQRVRLADHGVHLVPGALYKWTVTFFPASQNRFVREKSYGRLKCVAPSDTLEAQLRQARPADVPGIYAAAGLWYDAMAALSERLEAAPHDTALLEQWGSLLEQGGLKKEIVQMIQDAANRPRYTKKEPM